KKDLDPAMDYLINANSQGVMCRRVIVETFFGSNPDKDVNHTMCDPSHPQGCVQCVLTMLLVCCDLHNPTAFSFLNILPSVTIKNTAHSHLSKYTMDERELALCDTLEDWREAKAVTKLGSTHVMDFGTGFIFPSPMIDCIVNSTHHLKLWMINDLRKETHWSGVGLYSIEVLAIVHHIIPQPSDMPALVRMPVPACAALQLCPQVQLPAVVASTFTSKVRKNRCLACGLSGHNHKLCFFYLTLSLLTVAQVAVVHVCSTWVTLERKMKLSRTTCYCYKIPSFLPLTMSHLCFGPMPHSL
ncbi:hypothetical protein EDD16DRAFT_1472096, partial [Pisolithus croceorrhizus]